MMQKELITKKDYAAAGKEISHEKANDFVKAYEKAFPGEASGYYLGRNIIDKILAQPGCVGIRFHYGVNDKGQKTLVYIGVDADGKDLVKRTMVTENGVISSEEAVVADFIWVFWPVK
jgi:hypothetical protein